MTLIAEYQRTLEALNFAMIDTGDLALMGLGDNYCELLLLEDYLLEALEGLA